MEWVLVGGDFVEADVIRWDEPVYHTRCGAKGRRIITGERQITAQVLHIEDSGYADMEILAYTILDVTPGRHVPHLPIGERIGRHRRTLARADAHRLEWSDESARAVVTSKFIGISDAFGRAAVKPVPASSTQPSLPQGNRSRGVKPGTPRLTP